MTETPSDPQYAEAWLTGTPPDQTTGFYIPRGNTGKTGPRGPMGPSPLVGTVETNMGPAAPGTVGPPGLKGDKGDPGGFVKGTVIVNTTNLNDLTTDGIYYCAATSRGTALNYPHSTRTAGVLTVHTWYRDGLDVIQTFVAAQIIGVSGYDTPATTWRRTKYDGAWSVWRAQMSQRVDQTAGRAIYTFDEINNREQLIYGDTGWRDISANILNGHTGSIMVRRTLHETHLKIDVTPNATTPQADVFNWPSGFEPSSSAFYTTRPSSAVASLNVYTNNLKVSISTINDWQEVWGSVNWMGTLPCFEPWPITLPGTAIGTIPNA